MIVVEAGSTCGIPEHHGIEARRRAWDAVGRPLLFYTVDA